MEYQVKVIHNYYKHYQDQSCHTDFMKMLGVKDAGYNTKHSGKYFPLDRDDFFGLHILICDKKTDEVIVTFKVIPASDIQNYDNITFPLLEFAHETKDPHTINTIENFMQEMQEKNFDYSYSGGWTMNPKYAGQGLSKELKEIYTGIHLHVHIHYNLRVITGLGLLEMNTLAFFKNYWGLNEFPIASFKIPRVPGYNICMIYQYINQVTLFKKQMAKKYEHLWISRIEYEESMEKREVA